MLGRGARAQQSYPTKAVTVYSASSAGGAFDQSLRVLGVEWEKQTGQPLRPAFTPGPGNILTATRTLTAPADGYSLAMIGFATNNVAIHFMKPPNYTFGAFSYIGTTYAGPLALFVGKNSPIQTIEQLVEESKRRRVTAGISGAREIYHIGGLMFNRAVGANIQYVPYNGGGPSRLAAASGEADAVMSGLFDASTHYNLLRCLCVFGPDNPIKAQVPGRTMREAYGDKGLNIWHPVGIAAPAALERESPALFRQVVERYRSVYEASRPAMERAGFPKESLLLWTPEQIKEWERDFIASIRDIQI
ncbi:MAG: hypothetical protein IT557_09190 [Alphaproteobacteria bacterium]|nr:hypothetical protein [Alphaproteobacteria bacterium]